MEDSALISSLSLSYAYPPPSRSSRVMLLIGAALLVIAIILVSQKFGTGNHLRGALCANTDQSCASIDCCPGQGNCQKINPPGMLPDVFICKKTPIPCATVGNACGAHPTNTPCCQPITPPITPVLCVGGPPGTCQAQMNCPTTPAGTACITASECAACQAGPVAPGVCGPAKCCCPPAVVAPKLTVNTSWLAGQSNNGPKALTDFTLDLDGTAIASGVQVTMITVGSHNVNVLSFPRYTFSWSGACSGTNTMTRLSLASGDVKTCTVGIKYTPPPTCDNLGPKLISITPVERCNLKTTCEPLSVEGLAIATQQAQLAANQGCMQHFSQSNNLPVELQCNKGGTNSDKCKSNIPSVEATYVGTFICKTRASAFQQSCKPNDTIKCVCYKAGPDPKCSVTAKCKQP